MSCIKSWNSPTKSMLDGNDTHTVMTIEDEERACADCGSLGSQEP